VNVIRPTGSEPSRGRGPLHPARRHAHARTEAPANRATGYYYETMATVHGAVDLVFSLRQLSRASSSLFHPIHPMFCTNWIRPHGPGPGLR